MGDALAAFDAIPEFILIDPAQCGIDGRSLRLSPPRLCQRHGLNLHRINAGQPANAILIERDRCAILRRVSIFREKLFVPRKEFFPKSGEVV